jgi:hypothetical protein
LIAIVKIVAGEEPGDTRMRDRLTDRGVARIESTDTSTPKGQKVKRITENIEVERVGEDRAGKAVKEDNKISVDFDLNSIWNL